MAEPLLGWIAPIDRTPVIEAADAVAQNAIPRMAQFALPAPRLAKNERVLLTDGWKNPDVRAGMKLLFNRFRQLSGSCVGVGAGNALVSTIATQRITDGIEAFLPFIWACYAMARKDMGEPGPGEGCFGSLMAARLVKDGVSYWTFDQPGLTLPKYGTSDGIAITREQELAWSTSRNSEIPDVQKYGAEHRLGNAGKCDSVHDIRAAVLNGYGCSFACNNYVGNASVRGDVLIGRWDTFGPHQQSVHGYWEHPDHGPLYWAQNSWGGDTYPSDPSGGPVCGCWVKEDDVEAAMRLDSEVYLLSHMPNVTANPKVLDWFI